ncbi:MAG: NAD(P)-dependent oxidoreductase [Candidatus Binatia bacterium]|nr:MAG: NAD(P)-dependent oxidoreductase [Candidatus Binatia bacterium]
MRILVIGASGFVGRALLEEFSGAAEGTYFQHPQAGLRFLDMRDADAVAKMLHEVRPSWVLLPAAQPHVDWCEEHREESREINVQGSANVARAAREAGARVVFFSSDYVFDGASGPYDEGAAPAPVNVYGRQKLEAEQQILEANPANVVVRVCGVYGYESPPKNFVMTLLRRLQGGETVRVPSDQWGTPTYVRDIARVVRGLVEKGEAGIWHVAGPDWLPRHEFAHRVCAFFGLDAQRIQPVPTAALQQKAPRPKRAGLVARRASEGLPSCRGIVEGLSALASELRAAEWSAVALKERA